MEEDPRMCGAKKVKKNKKGNTCRNKPKIPGRCHHHREKDKQDIKK